TEFVEHNPKRKKNIFEQYMIQISVWIAGVSVFSLCIVFAWEWYEGRKTKNNPPTEITAPAEQTLQDSSKPHYGFPVLED
ncbi:MAG: hypothetical protein IT286_04515, partial [Proteobacteria bacterium]|nr:hypothetical protein [Pseudomonadota bacterium]